MYGSRFATTINFAPPKRVWATPSNRSRFQAMGRTSESKQGEGERLQDEPQSRKPHRGAPQLQHRRNHDAMRKSSACRQPRKRRLSADRSEFFSTEPFGN